MRPVVVACSLATMLVVTHLPVDLPAEEEAHGVVDWADAAAGGERDELAGGGVAADGAGLDDLEMDTAEAAPAHPVVVPWTGRARITAFAPGCGDSGRTATGTRPSYGTVATDPRVIPTYSHLEIEGLQGTFQALDTGGGVKGQHIDLWLATCAQARQWGNQYRAYRVF